MANWELGDSSAEPLTNKYEAIKTMDHQSDAEFSKAITSSEVPCMESPVCSTNLPFATHSNESINPDLAITAQGMPYNDYESDPMRTMLNSQELREQRKRQQNREAARKSKKKRELEDLQAKVKAISHETTMLRENIMRHSEEIEDLITENGALLEELRGVCDQETISRLESMDPENTSQVRQASCEFDRNIKFRP